MTWGRLVFNALGFQAVWWAWAFSAPSGEWWLGAVASLLFLLAHSRLALNPRADLLAVLACVVAGFVFDTSLMQAQWLTFALPNPEPLQSVQPWWMLLLWACLGCTFQSSLAWLQGFPRLAYPICAVFGWIAYDAAAAMGALTRTPGWESWVALVFFWGVFIPTVQRLTASREG